MSAANSVSKQNDRTCAIAIDTNTIHCPGAFCIYQTKKTLDSSFLFEIKAAD